MRIMNTVEVCLLQKKNSEFVLATKSCENKGLRDIERDGEII